jgi:glycosyltransferase involved in cell wall biosynthesis
MVRNFSSSNRVKIELIAKLLRENAHQVDLISPGEASESDFKFYPGFSESEVFDPKIPVNYASLLTIRRLNGFWSSCATLRLVKRGHRTAPYDAVILFNMKRPQSAVGRYALQKLKLPVILEYEDDAFVNVTGQESNGLVESWHRSSYRRLLRSVSACIGVSPHLLSQVPQAVPRLLLRGVVGDDIVRASGKEDAPRRNWVLFAGTHVASNGILQLVEAWPLASLSGWELHITGKGELTDQVRKAAEGKAGIVFHGMVERSELVRLMTSSRIGINPHLVSQTPGNVFAFKIIEYLGAGNHVITTRMGAVEPEVEKGITYMPDNRPETIAATLRRVVQECAYERTARQAVVEVFGPQAVSQSLDQLVKAASSFEAHRASRKGS